MGKSLCIVSVCAFWCNYSSTFDWRARVSQCDQMDRLVFFNLAIFYNENLLIIFKLCQSRFQTLPNIKLTLQKLQKTFAILTKWWYFAESGHTARYTTWKNNWTRLSNFVYKRFDIVVDN